MGTSEDVSDQWSVIKYSLKQLTMSGDLKNVKYHHDNAPAHMAAAATADLKIVLLEFQRPSYTPIPQIWPRLCPLSNVEGQSMRSCV